VSVALAACGMAVDIVLRIDLPKTATKVVGLGSRVSTVETTVKGKGRKTRTELRNDGTSSFHVTFWTFLYRLSLRQTRPRRGS
jgi:hypothetical protein